MKYLNTELSHEKDIEAYILKCESEYENRLRGIAREVLDTGKRFITLSGPTCSGKTTTAALLEEEIEASGHNAVTVSIDDFYLDNLRISTPEGEAPDFDSVKTIDLDCLAKVVNALRRGERVMIPKFDFLTGVRASYSELVPNERDIFVFEGIQAVYPEVTELFGDEYTSIFICIGDDITENGISFSAHEIRLLRRTVRDYKFRNATPAFTLKCWESVRSNEEVNIFPNARHADFLIDSFLPYELFVIAQYALPLYETVATEDENYIYARNLIDRLRPLQGYGFDPKIVPQNSMFREFIG